MGIFFLLKFWTFKFFFFILNMLYNKFPPEWKLWIWTNIVNGFDRESVFNILLNHGFNYNLIKNELEIDPVKSMIWQRQYTQPDLSKSSDKSIYPLNLRLCDNPNAYRFDSNLIELYRIPDFLTYDECDSLMNDPDEFLTLVENRFDIATGVERKDSDVVEIIKYNEKEGDIMNEYGSWTIIVFMDNILEGGELGFTKLDIKFKSVKGEAIVWRNFYPNGKRNENSEFINLPVGEGTKTIVIKNYSKEVKEVQEINVDI